MRRWLLALLQAAVTGGLLWWVFREEKVRRAVAEAFADGDVSWLLAGLACAGLSLGLEAVRWRVFLRALGIDPGGWRTLAISLIGAFFNLALPGAAGGDGAKALCVIGDFPQRKAPVILSLIADRLSGLLPLIVAAGVFTWPRWAALRGDPAAALLTQIALGFFIVCLAGLGGSLAVSRSIIARGPEYPMPGAARAVEWASMYRALLAQWRAWIAATALSCGSVAMLFATYACGARAFDVRADTQAIFAVMPVVDVVTMLPVALSGVGLREHAFQILLGAVADVPAASALLVSLSGFGCVLVWGLVGGLLLPFYRRRARR